jgi:hypothetical protein
MFILVSVGSGLNKYIKESDNFSFTNFIANKEIYLPIIIFVVFIFKVVGIIFNPIEIVNFSRDTKQDEHKVSIQKTLFIIFQLLSSFNK